MKPGEEGILEDLILAAHAEAKRQGRDAEAATADAGDCTAGLCRCRPA